MTVGLVGEGPAIVAVRTAVEDIARGTTTLDPGEAGTVELTVAVGEPGAAALVETNRAAREAGRRWIAVELGGVGGHAFGDVSAAVSGFGPDTGCYDCLCGRVAANADEPDGGPAPDATERRFAGALAGRHAARLTAGTDTSILGRVEEIPHATRQFLPLPGCQCSPGRDWSLPLAHTDSELEETMARAERALDPRVGIVREVGEVESFPAPYYLATLADTEGFSDGAVPSNAAGVAVDWNAAFVKAIGESLERYSAAVYRTASLPSGRPGAHADAIPPDRFVGAAEPSPTDGPLRWVPGRDLHGETAVALPATLVFFPPPERRIRPPSTTGLGLGRSTVDAVLAGLYETVERDAAMLAWYSTYEPLGLAVDDPAYGTLVRRARSENLDVTALLLTQDVDVPVVGVAVHRADGEWPRFAAGMGAALDPVEAAHGALAEALQNWMELGGMGPAAAAEEAGAIGHYADFPGTARRFVDVETTVPAASVAAAPDADGRAELDQLLSRLTDAGLDAYAVRLTPPDVAELGFAAVRVLVPTAQPLFTDTPYFGDRAETIPRELGFEPRPDRAHHPFP